ncbi:MAG: hemerythrin domain-containing protein [Verrucomicrobiota bacterium]|jgi:hemerythrin-like domain-containing protein
MKITEALVTEHTIFLSVFEQIERALPGSGTLRELRTLAGMVEGLLRPHAETETNLAYAALDQALAERGQLERLHQDHHEIDARLEKVRRATTCAQARRLFEAALLATREHFRYEERSVFPLLEQALQAETLAELGRAWLQRQTEAQPAAP